MPPASASPVIVSVVVPVYNGARFLGECLESLLAQEGPILDVVVVDDGSTDGSAEVAKAFPGVRVFRRAHEGLAATRNAGIRAARAQLIGFCDADDLWRPGKARQQVAYLEAHPDVAIVLCRWETSFEPGTPWPRWLRPDQLRGDLDGVSPTSGLFRRVVFDRLGGYREMDANGGDFDLLVRARAAGLPIVTLEDRLLLRRIHDDNTSNGIPSYAPGMLASVRDHMRARR